MDVGITAMIRRAIDVLLKGKDAWDDDAVEMVRNSIQTVIRSYGELK